MSTYGEDNEREFPGSSPYHWYKVDWDKINDINTMRKLIEELLGNTSRLLWMQDGLVDKANKIVGEDLIVACTPEDIGHQRK